MQLTFALLGFAKSRALGEVLDAPCNAVLSATDVVQQDTAPNLVVEVLSLATAERDRTTKSKLHARHGVKELWLADVETTTVEVLTNTGAGFERLARYSIAQTLKSALLPDPEIPLAAVF